MPSSGLRYALCSLFLVAVVALAAAWLPGVEAESVTTFVEAPSAEATVDPVVDLVDLVDLVDGASLEAALREGGVDLPEGSSVYAVRVEEISGGLAYESYEAGEGATYDGFWPASSVKVLAAVGALEYLSDLGFTGAAQVTMGRETFTVADVYEAAIADSSNEAYDLLVRIAGVDWLNNEFLTAENGFGATVIQRSYTGWGVDVSPAMTIVEGSRRASIPARRATSTYTCPDDGNCSSLLDLTESVRRVTLDQKIPEDERFDVAEADLAGLADALLAAEGFVEPAVSEVLGDETLVYNKPGYVPGDDCVDVALLSHETGSDRYLLAVTTPEDGSLCPGLVEVAAATLQFLEEESEA